MFICRYGELKHFAAMEDKRTWKDPGTKIFYKVLKDILEKLIVPCSPDARKKQKEVIVENDVNSGSYIYFLNVLKNFSNISKDLNEGFLSPVLKKIA